MSRRHEIDVNRETAHLSIFGGKLTDCVNVGNEVSNIVAGLGVHLPYPGYKWYGEPHPSVREEYMHQARLMNLDGYTSPESIETLEQSTMATLRPAGLRTARRRHSRRPAPGRGADQGTDYIRCEIRLAKRQEMITKLEDLCAAARRSRSSCGVGISARRPA